MSQSIKHRTGAMSINSDTIELRKLLEAALVDLAAMKVAVDALVVDTTASVANHNALVAKMNLDGGITDTDYAVATAQTSEATSALTLVS